MALFFLGGTLIPVLASKLNTTDYCRNSLTKHLFYAILILWDIVTICKFYACLERSIK